MGGKPFQCEYTNEARDVLGIMAALGRNRFKILIINLKDLWPLFLKDSVAKNG